MALRRNPFQTAILLAILLSRSKKTRIKFSKRTLEILSKRERIHPIFVNRVRDELDDLDVIMLETNRGGYALISRQALDGAHSMTSKHLLNDLRALRKGATNFEILLEELGGLGIDEEDEDEEDDID